MRRGQAAIGLYNPKQASNIGGVCRAAMAFGASVVFIDQRRKFKPACTDTVKSWRHMPIVQTGSLLETMPVRAVPVAIEVGGKRSLPNFNHPNSAFYIFGPEDGTLPKSVMERCRSIVTIPTSYCLNLAAAVNVVLYDRAAKAEGRDE